VVLFTQRVDLKGCCMPRLNVEIKSGVYKRFLDQCKEDGRSASDVVRELILDYVERRVREKFRIAKIEKEVTDE
jgi:predicted CopG family antitoxin